MAAGFANLSTSRVEQTNKLYFTQKVFEYGDKNNRLLPWLAKGLIPTTPIGCIKDTAFFQDIYSSHVGFSLPDLCAFLDDIPFPTLANSDREQLEANMEEIQEALLPLYSGKTPGRTAFCWNSTLIFIELLPPKLTSLFPVFSSLESLPDPMEEAIIVLVPKPG